MVDELNETPPSSAQGTTDGRKDFFVVGIGASAGGIAALREFFRNVRTDSGMTYVVILHLSPQHESNLPALLQSQTFLPVTQVTEPIKIEPDHVYVIPPAKYLAMKDGTIQLTSPEHGTAGHSSVDFFFRTLAAAYGRHAVAVLLSGAGSDGTLGIGSIKEEGGIVIVQDLAEAEYPEMARSAIDTLQVDLVLPVADIPSKLIALRDGADRLQLPQDKEEAPESGREADVLREVLALVRARTGNDFSQYKRPTILRRIARRMQVNEVHNFSDYLHVLRERPQEITALLRDFLITVTSFFRDREHFEVLAREIIPNIFERKNRQELVRVWSVGCATGEEAYSLAVLLTEHADRLPDPPGFQVFATDIDERAIAEARDCLYPASITLDVSAERLRRFFVKEGERYRVVKSLREMVLFAQHNILRDPPFSRIDLVSCRNLLIYLNREMQERVLATLHFCLRPNGYLFLGSSEAADITPNLFAPLDKTRRIYQRRETAGHPAPALGLGFPAAQPGGLNALKRGGDIRSIGELHQEIVEQFAPPSVLINEECDVLHASAHAGRYLRLGGGVPVLNLLKLAHPELRVELRSMLLEARVPAKAGEEQSRQLRIELDGQPRNLVLRVRQLTSPESVRGFFLVMFDEPAADADTGPAPAQPSRDDGRDRVVRHLEEELQRTKEQLRLVVEQYETSNEELRASNEELQAINEELRSATEELETSKEELQSLNEKLTTVNQEYREKLEEVGHANADLQNLMASTDIGTIFLDREMRIKRYTPPAQQLFNITQADLGRPLDHFTSKLEHGPLIEDAAEVLRTLRTAEREVRSQGRRWFLMRLVPYRTTDDHIDGVVLTFVDITHAREDRERLREQAKVISLAHVMMRSGDDDVIMLWNEGCERLYGYSSAEALGKKCHELLRTEFPRPLETIRAELDSKGEWQGELVQVTKDGSRIIVASHWVLNPGTPEKPATILEVNNDVTMRHVAEEALRVADRNKDQFLAMLAHELRNPVGAMLNSLELLNTSKRSTDASLARGVIERQLNHLMRLVDDLLDVERLTHGKIALVRRRVLLSEIVESATESCKSLIDTSQHNLKVRLPREPVPLNADATRLIQVFSNLLHNALKYTPSGGTIELSAERADSAVNVKVQDTGIGISPEILPRLFEMYAQGEPLSGNEMKGLGVGLALVRQIVQLHGGSVTAHSEGINRGSQFLISLPLAEEPEAVGRQREDRRTAAPKRGADGAGKRVMIVDDNRDASEALAMLLQRSGYITELFSDGASALDGAREFKPNAAILDVGLPGMNGYELAGKLREKFPKIKLIGLSGWRQDETAVHEAVFDEYLIKPAGLQEIEKLLSQL